MQLYFCNPNSSDRRGFWEIVKAYSVFGCIAATSYTMHQVGILDVLPGKKKTCIFTYFVSCVACIFAKNNKCVRVTCIGMSADSDVNKRFRSFGGVFGHVMLYIIH